MTTDSEIIRDSIAQPSRFGELFERHARAIGDYAARRVGHAAAEDVLSETFLVAFRRRASFDHTWETAKPWLFGIASRLIKRHRGDEAAIWRTLIAATRDANAVEDRDIDAAGDRVDASMSVRMLMPLIAALSRQDRDTLLLYAWGDLTYEEIGLALAIPVGTVRSRLNRVRRKLTAKEPVRIAALAWEEEVG